MNHVKVCAAIDNEAHFVAVLNRAQAGGFPIIALRKLSEKSSSRKTMTAYARLHDHISDRSLRRRMGLLGAASSVSEDRRSTEDPYPRALLDAIFYVLKSGCPWRATLCPAVPPSDRGDAASENAHSRRFGG